MITLVLTNRNRDLHLVKNCLQSLKLQSKDSFYCFLIDFGSESIYLRNLEELLLEFPKIKFISCPVSGQLWNKSRAINIALKLCETDYFFVGDIDMVFHPNFISKLDELKSENKITYFQVGFLNKEASVFKRSFEALNPAFLSTKEATGMTLYPTNLLKRINGYDEFYNGWGAEDTDVHVRLKNQGFSIDYYDEEIFLKHQWHPKTYRTKRSNDVYHFGLEKINHNYLKLTKETNKIKANEKSNWGVIPNSILYLNLEEKADFDFNIQPTYKELISLLSQLTNFENKVISITVKDITLRNSILNFIKRISGKKYNRYLPMKSVNDLLLQEIITHYRNAPYKYSFDQLRGVIHLKIYF